MKMLYKGILLLAVLSLLISLAACVSKEKNVDDSQLPPVDEQTDIETVADEDEESESKSLVVYFSWSGNTKQMAEWIADESGSDIYRVTPKEAYSTEYEECTERAKNELDKGIRPELEGIIDEETMAQYETIYMGFPIWWYDLPMSMTSFIESSDLSGKTVLPFFSHNGSSSGAGSLDTIKELCPDADVLTDSALSVSGNSVKDSEEQIRDWVRNVG